MSKKQSFQISLKLIQTQFNKGLQNARKQLKSFGSFVKGAFAVTSIVAFGKEMTRVGSEFENAMARVKAVTNASTKEFKMMQKEAERLGATTKYTATQAANALEVLTRNGMSATQATRALSGVLELAQANSIELANAADIVTNSLNMFGLEVSETARVNDVLSATSANSATDINLLYEALVNAAPAAHVLGFSIEETSAAIGALANKGIKGANAGTALRMALTKMADPKIIKKMNEMGVAIDEQTMKEEGLLATVKRLKDAQLSLSDLVSIFSQRGAVGIQQLIGAYEDFDLMLEITKNSAGTTARMFQQGVGSVQKEIATLKSKYEGLLISLSKKTSGAVKGAVRLLQNLIDNFKTVTGTVMNLASVAVPLLSKHVTNLVKTARAGIKAIKTEAASLSAVIGNWIGLIATAVTWIGTALYGAWNKTYGAVKEANKETEKTIAEYTKLRTQATYLINKLGPDTDKATLAGTVKSLCELFPDFKDAIHDAAIEASKTGNWEKLKSVLNDIVVLQGAVMAQDANRKAAEAAAIALGGDMWKRRGAKTQKPILNQIDEGLKKYGMGKSEMKEFYNNMARMLTESDRNTAIALTKVLLESREVYLSDDAIRSLADSWRGTQYGVLAVKANTRAGNAAQSINDIQAQLDAEAARRTQERIEAEEKAAKLEEELNEKKKKQKTIDDVKIQYDKELANITDDLAQEFINAKDAIKQLLGAAQKAYNDYRDLTGKKGEDNPYYGVYRGLNSGSMGLREAMGKEMAPALPALKQISPGPLQANSTSGINARPTNPVQQGMAGITSEQLANVEKLVSNIDTATSGLSQMHSITQSIVSSFETLNDENASFLDKLGASINIMSSIPAILKTINTVFGITNALQDVYNEKAGTGATLTIAEAIAAMFKGNGEIPIAGIAIAAAGVATLIAALAAAPKFATGGIVGGNSYSGDKNFARVNSGEMILNGGQQARLFNMLNGAGGAGTTHDVNFIIRGKDLYGTLKNYTNSADKIRSNI